MEEICLDQRRYVKQILPLCGGKYRTFKAWQQNCEEMQTILPAAVNPSSTLMVIDEHFSCRTCRGDFNLTVCIRCSRTPSALLPLLEKVSENIETLCLETGKSMSSEWKKDLVLDTKMCSLI